MRSVRDEVFEAERLLMDFFHRLIEFFAYPVDFIIRMSGDLYFLIEPIDTQRIEESKQLVELLERTIDEDAWDDIGECSENDHKIETDQDQIFLHFYMRRHIC